MKEKIKDFIKENWLKTSLLVTALIGGISISYYFVILLPDLKWAEITSQKMENYRKECKKEIEDDFKFLDNMPPELAKIGLKNKGYINETGYIIQTDILVKRCIDSKVLIYE